MNIIRKILKFITIYIKVKYVGIDWLLQKLGTKNSRVLSKSLKSNNIDIHKKI